MGGGLLYAGFETCFGWDPEHPRCWDPIAKLLSNQILRHVDAKGSGINLRLIGAICRGMPLTCVIQIIYVTRCRASCFSPTVTATRAHLLKVWQSPMVAPGRPRLPPWGRTLMRAPGRPRLPPWGRTLMRGRTCVRCVYLVCPKPSVGQVPFG